MTFGERLSKLLNEKNMTQKELSDKAGVNVVSMSRYVHGTRTPRARVLMNMAKALDVSTDYLLGVEDRDE